MHSTSLRAVALSALALFAALNGNAAVAATQGSQGATSAGSIAITLSVAGRVQISGLSDVSFVSVSPDVAAVSAQNVCVWSNTATKGYSLSASGSGAGSAFELAGTSSSVTYSVAWNDTAGQSAGTPLSAGTELSGQTSSATNPDCSSGGAASSTLIVQVEPAALQTAQPDTTYAGALNLLVSPE